MDVISVEALNVAYKLYARPTDILREALFGGKRHDTFWALRNVSLNVRDGERIGIVGPNGAGKSTLLKVIAGNLTPTTGRVAVHGKISSLLSMTPSWNEELSGIENARYNLAMQGISERRIRGMIEDIADFTELGAFLTRPVKMYSTGMSARLSFAIATATDPEILIIDEVLGTGDGYFAAKAANRMKQFCERGRALLFVSHSTHHVRSMCQRCIWIENGTVRLSGPAETVIRQYEEDMLRKDEASNREGNKARIERMLHSVSPEDLKSDDLWCLRIRSKESLNLTDTHYIKAIEVEVDGQRIEVPLDIVDVRMPSVSAALDTLSCEWGRPFERLGDFCRTLSPKIGVRKGGYIWVKRSASSADSVSISCSFEHSCADGKEDLTVDVLDVGNGQWTTLGDMERTSLSSGWRRVAVGGCVKIPDNAAKQKLIERSVVKHQRPIEISNVEIISQRGTGSHIRESDAFKVCIGLKSNEVVETLNVSINIFRLDGVFVFYQASCLDGVVRRSSGVRSVEFMFDPNPLGAGEYEINVFATNSFRIEEGPPSDIYDRHIGVRLTIVLARPFEFGLVNAMVPVAFVTSADSAAE